MGWKDVLTLGNANTMMGGISSVLGMASVFGKQNDRGEDIMAGGAGLLSGAGMMTQAGLQMSKAGSNSGQKTSGLLGLIAGGLSGLGGVADLVSWHYDRKAKKATTNKQFINAAKKRGIAKNISGILGLLGGMTGIAQGIFGLKSADNTEDRRSAIGNLITGGLSLISGGSKAIQGGRLWHATRGLGK